MRKILLGSDVHDAIVRNPFCRYTILPAGIVVVTLLVGLGLCRLLNKEYSSAEDMMRLVFGGFALSAPVVGLVLTGRWLPSLIGWLLTFMAAYGVFSGKPASDLDPALMVSVIFLWCLFILTFLGLICLDAEAASRRPALSPRMKRLIVVASISLGILVLAVLLMRNPIQVGLLASLSMAFWFTVVLDLVWRISYDGFGRFVRGLMIGFLLYLFLAVFVFALCGSDSEDLNVLVFILGFICGQFWSYWIPRRDAEVPEDPPPAEQTPNPNPESPGEETR